LIDGSVYVFVPGARCRLGAADDDEDATDEKDWRETEKPAHDVVLSPFFIGKYKVSMRQFEAFVKATRFETQAERIRAEGKAEEGKDDFWWDGPKRNSIRGASEVDCRTCPGATWRDPGGRAEPEAKPDEPVRQVTWAEARAYAHWAGAELPSEAQWECAARWDPEAQKLRKYPWGDTDPEPSFASFYLFPVPGPGPVLRVKDMEARNRSAVGAVQMAGSIREIVLDNLKRGYYRALSSAATAPRDPVAVSPSDAFVHMTKGSSFLYPSKCLRSSARKVFAGFDNTTSFRLSIALEEGR
jgi:formylglycine-generating enzyme required for sulfatase activity